MTILKPAYPQKKQFGQDSLNLHYVVEFNNAGLITRYHNRDGWYPYDFYYDSQNRMVVKKKYHEDDFSDPDPSTDTWHFTYDAAGNLVSNYGYYATPYKCRLWAYSEYTYRYINDTLYVNELMLYKETRTVPCYYKRLKRVDPQGRIVNYRMCNYKFDKDGSISTGISEYVDYKYTASSTGQKQVKTTDLHYYETAITQTGTYNPNGTLAEFKDHIVKEGVTTITTKKYTYAPGLRQTDITYAGDTINNAGPAKKVVKYDGKGNKVSEVYTCANEAYNYTISWQYTYDAKGNWTTCIEDKNGNVRKTVRVLHYTDKPIPPRPVPAIKDAAKTLLPPLLEEYKFKEQEPLYLFYFTE